MSARTPVEIAKEYAEARMTEFGGFAMPDRYAFKAAIEAAIGEYAAGRDALDQARRMAAREIVGKCNRLEPNDCSVCRQAWELACRINGLEPDGVKP